MLGKGGVFVIKLIKMNIRRRFFFMLLIAGLFSFLILGSGLFLTMYLSKDKTMEGGKLLGDFAVFLSERTAEDLAQRQLMAHARKSALRAEEELRDIMEAVEFLGLSMERVLIHPPGQRSISDPNVKPIAAEEAYIYFAPEVRGPEALAAASREAWRVSGMADIMETMAAFYKGYKGCLFVASEKGYMFCVDSLPPGEQFVLMPEVFLTSYVPKERFWYKAAVEKDKVNVTEARMADDGYPCIDCAMPYRENGELGGVVGISLSLQSMYHAVMDLGVGGTGINFALNDQGKVQLSSAESGIFHASDEAVDIRELAAAASEDTDARRRSSGKRIRNLAEELQSMTEGKTGVALVLVEGEEYYLAYAPIPSVHWSYGTLLKAEEVRAPAQAAWVLSNRQMDGFIASVSSFFRESLWNMVFILLVMLVILFIASRMAADTFVLPIMSLTKGVRDIAKGDLDKKLDIRTGDEIEELSDSVNQMTRELKEYMGSIAKAMADKQRIATELSLASGIQEGILPKVFTNVTKESDYEIFATMEAAKSVGGDFYDFYKLDKEHLAVTIADVSEKGVPAALFMMISKTIVKNNAVMVANGGQAEQVDWADIMELSNRQLCENNDEMMFVTLFFGVLNTKTGDFSYVNCGHNPPLIGRASQDGVKWQYIRDEAKAHMMGVIEEAEYTEQHLSLRPGDLLYLYTDGVTEAMDEDAQLYSEERLQETLDREAAADISVRDLLKGIRADIALHVGKAEQSDDITMLGLRYWG